MLQFRRAASIVSSGESFVVHVLHFVSADGNGVRSRTFDAIAVAEYALYALPTGLGMAQWCTRHRDYSDNRTELPATEMSKLTRPCIGPLSQLVNDLCCY